MADRSESNRGLKEARHKGWLAGVAYRLDRELSIRNPFVPGSEEYLQWQDGFEEGFKDG